MNNSLAEVHPELVSEWSEKNLTLTPDDITFGSNKKVWWKGTCGHEWQTSVKARSNGEKCPICSGARVIAGINDLATLEPLLAKQWSKKNKIKPTEVSIGSHKKVIWRCKKGHEWEAVVKSRTINKTGCPYCSHNKVLAGFNDLATLLPDIAAEWSDRNYPLLPTQVTVFANRKAWWKCKDCGREWNTLISTRSGGSKCPYCSGYIFLKGFNDLQTTHPEIATEWSEKNLPLKPDEVNAKSRKNVWWRCDKCGNEWKSVINARVKGTVCPVCAEREVLAGYNDLATTDSQLLGEWDYEKNKWKPTEVSRNSSKRAWWKCRHGHSWSMKINERRGAIKTTDKDIAKTALLAKEFREAGQTAANAFRTFADKPEVDYSQKEQKHPITKAVLAPMKAVKKMLVSMKLHLDASIDKLDNLAIDVRMDKEKHMENAKVQEQTEPERAEAERVEAEIVYSPMVAEPQEYQYNADAFEARGVDEVKQEAAHKEVSKVREDKAR